MNLLDLKTFAADSLNMKEHITPPSGVSNDLWGTLNSVINVALAVIGFIAVVMIILGGFQYTTSAGDASKVTKAKNTILYGIIGLVVALLAYAIVNFVLDNIFGTK